VEAGGKGINVSRNLVANGAASRAVAPVGGPSGEQFISLLEGSGIDLVCVPVAGAVRMNVSLAEAGGSGTKINASGPRLSGDETDRLLDRTSEVADGASWLAVCGSLPPGAPDDLHARAVALGREAGCRVAVDTSGAPMRVVLGVDPEDSPDLVKPNLEELAWIVGRRLHSFGEVVSAAKEVRAAGVETVLVSLGADGAILVDGDGVLHADTPPFTPASAVGAGDALLAGFLSGNLEANHGESRETSLVEAVAWGAAAARLPGSRGPGPGDLERESVRLHGSLDVDRQLKGEAPR
jgi:1-phosphofructokinase